MADEEPEVTEVVTAEETGPEIDASTTEIEAPDAVVEASPTIIVETPTDTGTDEGEIDRAVETERRFGDIESQLGALTNAVAEIGAQVSTLSFQQENLDAVVANEAAQLSAVEDAVAETVAEDLELDEDNDPDTPPDTAKRHWWFKSYKELRGKD